MKTSNFSVVDNFPLLFTKPKFITFIPSYLQIRMKSLKTELEFRSSQNTWHHTPALGLIFSDKSNRFFSSLYVLTFSGHCLHVSHSVSELFLLSDDIQISMRKNAIANSRGSSDTDVSHSGVGPERSTHTKKSKNMNI